MSRLVEGLVSTILPVRNRAMLLGEAVESILAQTHRPIEIVIVDDGSTDDTPEAAEALARRHPEIAIVRQENLGPGPARNAGLARASGEYIQYLDSDDLLVPEKFEQQVRALRADAGAALSYCVTMRPYCSRPHDPWARTGESMDRILPEFLLERGWATLTPLWRRTVCERIGPWSDFRVMEDWEYDCRAGILGARPLHCPLPLAIVRDHPQARASGLDVGFTPQVIRDYFRAHRSVVERLHEAGLTEPSYMAPLSRKLFWIARLCGEKGLGVEAAEALRMAGKAAAPRRTTLDMRAYAFLARAVGWRAAAVIADTTHAVRRVFRERERE